VWQGWQISPFAFQVVAPEKSWELPEICPIAAVASNSSGTMSKKVFTDILLVLW
jgi:hypothetical protein